MDVEQLFVPQAMCLELVDYLVIRSGLFSVMLAPSGLVLFLRNQVAVLVVSSYLSDGRLWTDI